VFRNRRRPPRPDGSGAPLLAELASGYEALGATLQEILPPGWSRSWILAEMGPDEGMIVGAVTMGEATALRWTDLTQEVYAIFRRMYASTVGSTGDVWTSMTFDLDAGGHFDVAFGYEPRSIDDQSERVRAWADAIQDSLR
jgi:hypothetical protein